MTTITSAVPSVPVTVESALRRVRSEQHRAVLLLAGGAKYRRLSTLHEQEARLWTLLVRHTAEPVHRRAATDAQCTARARAREYAECAEYAQEWIGDERQSCDLAQPREAGTT